MRIRLYTSDQKEGDIVAMYTPYIGVSNSVNSNIGNAHLKAIQDLASDEFQKVFDAVCAAHRR